MSERLVFNKDRALEAVEAGTLVGADLSVLFLILFYTVIPAAIVLAVVNAGLWVVRGHGFKGVDDD